ncbi:unnamed protein product, partial [Brenthis ino]
MQSHIKIKQKHQPTMIGKPEKVSEPLEKVVKNKRNSLLDLKSLLEDRGGIIQSSTHGFKRSVFEKDKKSSNNSVNYLNNNFSFETTFSESNNMRCRVKGRCCRLKTLVCLLLVAIFVDTRLQAEARSSGECF